MSSRLASLCVLCALLMGSAPPVVSEADAQSPMVSEAARTRAARETERGEQLLTRGRRRAAEGAFARAMRLDPTAPAPIARVAELWLGGLAELPAHPTTTITRRATQVMSALDGVPEAVRREQLQLTEALALAATGDHAGALAVLTRAPRLVSDQLGPAVDALALLAAERGDLATAESALRLAFEAAPEAPRAQRLANLLLARGRAAQAVTVLHAALGFEPDDVLLRVALAEAQLAAGAPEDAAAGLSLVAPRCPFRCGALLARIALESGDATLAARRARELLARAASGPAGGPDATVDADAELEARTTGGYVLGLALLRLGQPEEARSALAEVLRRAPDHRGARQALRAAGP